MHLPPTTAVLLGSALLAIAAAHAASPLPPLSIDTSQTSVSGLSSGGFMAVQLHVAHSATFKKGAGIVAGGPFYCAEGSIVNATGRCMASPAGIPTSRLVSTTNTWAGQGTIDPVSNLASSKVYLFSGTLDSTVKPGVMDALNTYYQSFVPSANIVYKKNIAAEHAMITDDYGNTCSTNGTPYINNCNFDLAGAILQQIYGTLNARNTGTLGGTFTEFDQTAFVTNHGMATTGWVYVPQACTAGTQCKVHVVLHGCKQNVATVGDKYVRNDDGSYTYSGRSDDMLKVSGIYVSPFEVEATLVQHPAVLETAVIGKEDADGLTKTKAFVLLKPGAQASEDELKAFVKDRLAPYKYPRFIEFVSELPKTATGKIQRFKLREQDRSASQ